MRTTAEARFDEHRGLLTGVAYRIVGQISDAEDVVQEAWLRWSRVDDTQVADARAFLVRTTVRLAIDRLRRVEAARETYPGPWLPEPPPAANGPAEAVELADSVSMALLVVLERLSPLERAVFVLREAFGAPYGEIAEVVGRSEPAVRQLAARANRHVREGRTRFDADSRTGREVTARFMAACASGDYDALLALLAPGATLVGDGGGRVRAPLRTIAGADKVARFLLALSATDLPDTRTRVWGAGAGPGLTVTSAGRPVAAIGLHLVDGLVAAVYLVANPDKLRHLSA